MAHAILNIKKLVVLRVNYWGYAESAAKILTLRDMLKSSSSTTSSEATPNQSSLILSQGYGVKPEQNYSNQ